MANCKSSSSFILFSSDRPVGTTWGSLASELRKYSSGRSLEPPDKASPLDLLEDESEVASGATNL